MESLRAMFWLHYEPSGPLIALWDDWMANATHNHVLDITATQDGGLKIAGTGPPTDVLAIHAPPHVKLLSADGVAVQIAGRPE